MKLCVCEKDTMNLDFIFCDRSVPWFRIRTLTYLVHQLLALDFITTNLLVCQCLNKRLILDGKKNDVEHYLSEKTRIFNVLRFL